MNIQNLLKKLEKNTTPQRKSKFHVEAPYKIKTIQSIGTLNSQPDQTQHSFVIHDTLHNKSNVSGFSGYSKLDEELSQIDKMKQKYETRQNKSIGKNIHNQISNSKSTQKHCLKPSNTPSFNKVTKLSSGLNISGRNLYQQEKEENLKKHQRAKTFEHIYYKADELDQNYQPCEQDSFNRNQVIIDQSSQKKGEQSSNKWAIAQHQLSHNFSQITTPQKQNTCNCNIEIQKLQTFLQNKFNQFEKRMSSLEQENKEIKHINGKLGQKIKNLQEANQILAEERNQERNRQKKLQEQKQELQSILKDVLYRRQREKIIATKQNTQRQNDKKLPPTHNNTSGHSQRKTEAHPHEIKAYHNNKNSQSKMKVENLLQKLQIKIDRA